MNINQLRTVLALAESGSMTITAKKLHVTQPALTYQINNIEKELGFKVFERSHAGTSVTREGSFFCDELRSVLAEYDEAIRLSREFARRSSLSEVRIGVNDSSRNVSSQFLRLVQKEISGTDLTNVSCGSVDVYGLLRRGVIDLWSCSSVVVEKADHPDLAFQPLVEEPLRVYLGRSHHLARAQRISIEDLEGESIYLFSEGGISSVSDAIRDYIRRMALNIEVLDFPQGIPPMMAAQTEDAIAIYDEGYTAPYSHRIASVPLNWPDVETIGFAYLKSEAERLSPIIKEIQNVSERYRNRYSTGDDQLFGQMVTMLDDIAQAVRAGDRDRVEDLVRKAVDIGVPGSQILYRGLADGASAASDDLREGRVPPQAMVAAAAAMVAGNKLLKSLFGQDEGNSLWGTAVIGTMEGDVHQVGKDMVGIMLQAKGIEVSDLGVDVPPRAFVEHVRENKDCNLILVSANRDQAREKLFELVQLLAESRLRDRVFLMVGGSAVDERFAHEIGADAFTHDAAEAAEVAFELLSY